MLKIDNFECLICNKIYKEPIELPCGFICCRNHIMVSKTYTRQDNLSILCFFCNKFHHFDCINLSKIYEQYFKTNEYFDCKDAYIKQLEILRELRCKFKQQLKVSNFNCDSFENLINCEKEQIIFELNRQLDKLKNDQILKLEKIKNYSHYLIKILQQEKHRICEKIKNKELFDSRLLKDLDKVVRYFKSNPIIVNKTNYREFVKNYKKLDSITSAITNSTNILFDFNIRNFSYQVNHLKTKQFSFLDDLLKKSQVIFTFIFKIKIFGAFFR